MIYIMTFGLSFATLSSWIQRSTSPVKVHSSLVVLIDWFVTDRSPSCTMTCNHMPSKLYHFTVKFRGVSEESLKPVPFQALPESSMQDEEAEKQGELHRDAAKAFMRLLWLSRLSRPDLLFIIGGLASNVSRWSKWDDRQLHRVASYLKHTISLMCCGRVSYGHKPELYVYTDADFDACPWTARSTTGIFIGVKTGDSLFPIHWQSRKQSSSARSTPEAEIIAFASALYGETLHVQELLTTHATF